MACMPVVIFYLIWLVNTSEGIRSEEGTLLDLVCWPDGNAIPVIIACGSVIAVVIEVPNPNILLIYIYCAHKEHREVVTLQLLSEIGYHNSSGVTFALHLGGNE